MIVSFLPALPWKRLALVLAAGSMVSCGLATRQDEGEAGQVKKTFAGFKHAVFSAHAAAALGYVDQASLDYLARAARETPDPATPDAEVKQLIHLAIVKMTPQGVGPGFTLAVPLQRILDQGWMNTHGLDSISLGPVTVTGDRARAEALWQGTHTTYQVSFVREKSAWKIDLLGVLPYAEMGMQLARALRNETEAHQLARLVVLIPAPWK